MRCRTPIKLILAVLILICIAVIYDAPAEAKKKDKHWKDNGWHDNGWHNGQYKKSKHYDDRVYVINRPRVIALQPNSVRYVRVIDVLAGNIIRVSFGDNFAPMNIRLIGCDTWWDGRDSYRRRDATLYTARRLKGRKIWVQIPDQRRCDYDDRVLGYAWLSRPGMGSYQYVRSNLFNSVLLSNGRAVVSTKYPADTQYVLYMK